MLQNGRLGVAVLSPEPAERVEAVVDRLQASGIADQAGTKAAQRSERLVHVNARRLEPLPGGGECGIETAEIAEHAHRARQAGSDRVRVLGEQRGDLGEAGRKPLGMLQAPPLRAQLIFLPDPQPCGVELRDLKPQQVLALRAVPLGTPRALDFVARRTELREEVSHALGELVDVREPVHELQLSEGLEQPLMLVLSMDVHQLLSEPLEQGNGHGRIVDERAVAAGARELPSDHHLSVLSREPGLAEHRRRAAILRSVEHRLHRGRLGIGPDDVGLGARTTQEQERVDEDRLAGAGLAGENVQAGRKDDGDVFDNREVPDPQLAEPPPRL
jgi:hypothetical protein